MPSRPPGLHGKPKRQITGWSRETRQARGYGREHDAMRARVLREEPLCRMCAAEGRVSATAIADHIVPKAEGGTDDRTNYQGACDPCHRRKTAQEAQRGRARAR